MFKERITKYVSEGEGAIDFGWVESNGSFSEKEKKKRSLECFDSCVFFLFSF